jgi:hypothetical protein
MDVIGLRLLAYVGPGPGLTMFWAFVGLLSTIVLAVFSVVYYPIRNLIRSIRGVKPPDGPGQTEPHS